MTAIADKTVTITKYNSLYSTGVFFRPCVLGESTKADYYYPMEQIHFLLNGVSKIEFKLVSCCFPRAIYDYLRLQSYRTPMSLTVRNVMVFSAYRELGVISNCVDLSLKYNAVCFIYGGERKYYAIANGFYEIDAETYGANSGSGRLSYGSCSRMIVADDSRRNLLYVTETAQRGNAVDYVVPFSEYNDTLAAAVDIANLRLFLSDGVKNGIFYGDEDGGFRRLVNAEGVNVPVKTDGETVRRYVGNTFMKTAAPDKAAAKTELLAVKDGKMVYFDGLKDEKRSLTVNCRSYDEFMASQPDEKLLPADFNEGLYRKVEYVIKFVPPLLTEDYAKHASATDWEKGMRGWRKAYKPDKLKRMIASAESLATEGADEFKLVADELSYIDGKLNDIASIASLKLWLTTKTNLIRYHGDSAVQIFTSMYDSVYVDNDDVKVGKIKEEIAVKQSLIKEKKKLLKKDPYDLSATGRIKRLEEEIGSLELLIKRFVSEKARRITAERQHYIERCQQLLDGGDMLERNNAFSRVLGENESTKEELLMSFTSIYLKIYVKYLKELGNALDVISKGDLPGKFGLYTKNGKNYVAVSDYEDVSEAFDYADEKNAELIVKR